MASLLRKPTFFRPEVTRYQCFSVLINQVYLVKVTLLFISTVYTNVVPHQSNKGGEDHPHPDHHPLLRFSCRPNRKVVAGKESFHQSLLHLRRTCMTDQMYWQVITVISPLCFVFFLATGANRYRKHCSLALSSCTPLSRCFLELVIKVGWVAPAGGSHTDGR